MWHPWEQPEKMRGLIADLLKTIEASEIDGYAVREIPDALKNALNNQQGDILASMPFRVTGEVEIEKRFYLS